MWVMGANVSRAGERRLWGRTSAPVDRGGNDWFRRKGVTRHLNYGCGGELNHNGYCNPKVDKLIDRQSVEADQERRKQLVLEIERKLAEDGARPIFFYDRRATCWQPWVKGLTIMVNSISNGARMEDVWLDN
jgi:ABC-type transport system substrate-binding protein